MPGTRPANSKDGQADGDDAAGGPAPPVKDDKVIVADLRRTSGRHSLGIQLALTNGRVTVADVKARRYGTFARTACCLTLVGRRAARVAVPNVS